MARKKDKTITILVTTSNPFEKPRHVTIMVHLETEVRVFVFRPNTSQVYLLGETGKTRKLGKAEKSLALGRDLATVARIAIAPPKAL
jgi:hypothetical protein